MAPTEETKHEWQMLYSVLLPLLPLGYVEFVALGTEGCRACWLGMLNATASPKYSLTT